MSAASHLFAYMEVQSEIEELAIPREVSDDLNCLSILYMFPKMYNDVGKYEQYIPSIANPEVESWIGCQISWFYKGLKRT